MHKLVNAVKYFYYGIQLAVGVIAPFIVCLLVAGWLKERYSLGNWVTVAALVLAVLIMLADMYSYGRMLLKMLDKKGDKPDEQDDKK